MLEFPVEMSRKNKAKQRGRGSYAAEKKKKKKKKKNREKKEGTRGFYKPTNVRAYELQWSLCILGEPNWAKRKRKGK